MVSVCVPTTGFSTWYSPSPVFLQAEIDTTARTAATAANLRTRRLPSKSVLAGRPGDIRFTSVLKRFALHFPHSPKLVHLCHFAAYDEEEGGVVDPNDHQHQCSDRAAVKRPWVEGPDIGRKRTFGDLQQDAREQRRYEGGPPANLPMG